MALQADVTDGAAVQRMVSEAVEAFGGIDIVVNNALSHYSFNPKQRATAWNIEWDDYQRQLDGSLGRGVSCLQGGDSPYEGTKRRPDREYGHQSD